MSTEADVLLQSIVQGQNALITEVSALVTTRNNEPFLSKYSGILVPIFVGIITITSIVVVTEAKVEDMKLDQKATEIRLSTKIKQEDTRICNDLFKLENIVKENSSYRQESKEFRASVLPLIKQTEEHLKKALDIHDDLDNRVIELDHRLDLLTRDSLYKYKRGDN